VRHPHKRSGRLTRKQRRRIALARQRRWELENAALRAQIAAFVASPVERPADVAIAFVVWAAACVVVTAAAVALVVPWWVHRG
jgi:hypothetical protein